MSGQVSPYKMYSATAWGRLDIYCNLFTGMKTNPSTTNLVFQRPLSVIHKFLLK